MFLKDIICGNSHISSADNITPLANGLQAFSDKMNSEPKANALTYPSRIDIIFFG